MGKCVLIGGGEVGRGKTSYETGAIDREIVSMTEKTHPTFLFIGLASSYADSYYDTMKKIYRELGCECVYLKKNNLIHNPDLVKSKILQADIIYIGGGDTIKLLDSVFKYHLDELLREAYTSGTVMVGLSAGAILLSKEGFSDSRILRGEGEHYEFIKGLGLVDISICPHFHSSKEKDLEFQMELKQNNRHVYGLEDGTALKIVDSSISIIPSIPNRKVYYCTYQKNNYCEELL